MRKNKDLQSTRPLTISAQAGLVDQTEYFNKQIASKQLKNYLLLKQGDFAYNKSYSVGYPYGAIKRLNNYDAGVLSTLYLVFKPLDDISSDFLEHYYDSSKWYTEIYRNAAEGARNHGLLNISSNDFFNTILTIPVKIKEQNKIANLLNILNKLLSLQQRKLEQLKQLKKAMLQQLLVSKKGKLISNIRFKDFTETWEQRKLGKVASFYSGGTPSVSNSNYYGGTIPFIRSSEINSISTELYLSKQGLQNSSAKMVRQGDILYALYGATSGEVGISNIHGAINQAILAIIPNKNYDSKFLVQWLRKNKEAIIKTYLQGGQGNLSGAIVKQIKISFPNFDEQEKIGEFFKQLDFLITLHQRRLNQISKVKKFCLQKMFI
ncbi:MULTISPECIES: restriction endonuclease subunit S [Limosilactobacillus]|uniref:restriction endonuclease subunit S n=1 Tax=Limosilactobacillus TaxID=2742598 RepID=UPI001F3EDDAD|nr:MULTISPECIES: restriction endonuclease subunit S [Limosilactobacillus]